MEKNWSSGPKKEQGLPSKEIPMRNTSAGGWKLRCTVKGPGCKPVVRNLPEVKPRTLLLGVSSTDIPLQGASSSSIPTVRGLGHLVSGVGELRLTKKALSGCARQRLKKTRARASEAGTEGIQQPENAGMPKQGETSIKTLKRPMSEDSTPTEMARSSKRPMDSRRR
jgi:hypothetical protein